jgi:hypothetical protein
MSPPGRWLGELDQWAESGPAALRCAYALATSERTVTPALDVCASHCQVVEDSKAVHHLAALAGPRKPASSARRALPNARMNLQTR